MAFRFALEAVLKHRGRLEDMAQREFMEAQNAVDECLRTIEAMYKRMDEVREEISEAQSKGSSENIQKILEMEGFIQGQKIRIEALRLKARELMAIAEAKQEALIEAAREKKILVKLKEKRKKDYLDHMQKIEAKELDDMTMVRHGRRKS